MKLLFILLITITTQASLLASMTPSSELKYVQKLAKEVRRDLWIAGHQYVDSTVTKFTKVKLDSYVKQENNSRFESPLAADEIGELYRCFYKSICSLYLISANSSYYSGYGVDAHFVLLNTEEGNHLTISHAVYSE